MDNIRDFGVLVDSKFTFKAHINNIIHNAFIKINLILKCFHSRDQSTYVCPILK